MPRESDGGSALSQQCQQDSSAQEGKVIRRLTMCAAAAALGLAGYFTALVGGVFVLAAVSSTGSV